MIVLFAASDFENFFTGKILQKGLSLYKKGKVDLLVHPTRNTYSFFISGHELQVKKAGQKFLESDCTCARKTPCEHLAAAVFYFFPALGADSALVSLKAPRDPVRKEMQEEIMAWREFFRQAADPSSPKSGKNRIVKECEVRFRKAEGKKLFFRQLAFLSECFVIQSRPESPENTGLSQLISGVKDQLQKQFRSKGERSAAPLFYTCVNALRNNAAMSSDSFYFLGIHFLAMSMDVRQITEYSDLLHKRRDKSAFNDTISKLSVLKAACEIKISQLEKDINGRRKPDPYRLMARAEMLIVKGKKRQALKILIQEAANTRKNHADQFAQYISYVLQLARDTGVPSAEMQALQQKFMHEPFIAEEEFSRFLRLARQEKDLSLQEELITELEKKGPRFSFQKLSVVLLATGRFRQLLNEIRMEGNQFRLLHKLSMKLLPDFDPGQLNLYASQLFQAIESARYHQVQIKLLDLASEYLEKLPAPVSAGLLEKISGQLGHRSQLSQYLSRQPGAA